MTLEGRVAVVTGGASGIGAATAEALRGRGAVPVVWDLDGEIRCDVTDPVAVAAALEETTRRHGLPTLLVASAGVRVPPVPGLLVRAADVRRTLDVNLFGALHVLQALGNRLVENGGQGSMVVVTSVNGTIADEGRLAYSVSKAAANMLVKVLARETGRHGIRVNAVAPGPTATPMLAPRLDDADYLEDVAARTPLGRIASPADIAEAIVNVLASDWVTGQVIAVDGGSSLSTGRASS